MNKKIIVGISLAIIIIGIGLSGWYTTVQPALISRNIAKQELVVLPEGTKATPAPVGQSNSVADSAPTPETKTLPKEVLISVPFTSQAPIGIWDKEAEESCEEAAVLMASWFASGQTGLKQDGYDNRIPLTQADKELKTLIQWQKDNLGTWESTNTKQVLQMIKGRENTVNAELITDITAEKVKRELAAGHIVLLPAAGRSLHNPYFKTPGPVYHYVLVKGYNDRGFILNDPGTRHGENYIYKEDVLLSAVHDWTGNGDTIESGAKVGITVTKK
jgi:hypothetical protein